MDVDTKINSFFLLESGNDKWMVPTELNGLCKMIDDENVVVEKWFDEFDDFSTMLFNSAISIGDYIVLIPGNAKKIGVFNTITTSFELVDYKPPQNVTKKQYVEANAFQNAIVSNGSAYIFGAKYPAIIKLNVETMSISYIVDWTAEIDEYLSETDKEEYFCGEVLLFEKDLYVASTVKDVVLKINTNSDKTELIHIENEITKIFGMCKYKDYFVVLCEKNGKLSIVEWSPTEGFLGSVELSDSVDYSRNSYWWNPIILQNTVYVIPQTVGNVLKISLIDKKVEVLKVFENCPKEFNTMRWTITCFVKDVELILNTHWNKKMYAINPTTNVIKPFEINVIDDEYKRRKVKVEVLNDSGKYIMENDISLQNYIDVIKDC